MRLLDETVRTMLVDRNIALENYLKADVVFISGNMEIEFIEPFKRLIETLQGYKKKYKNLCIILKTLGGSAEIVELLVGITRNFYKEVYFIVPNYAYSAGTIFCMSGDKIYMDYASTLGPIDPQILNFKGEGVPALGYLDRVEMLLQKAKKGELSNVELLLLRQQDFAFLQSCEQAKNLTIALLENGLVKYKFKDGNKPLEEKKERAKGIAAELGDNKKWLSHHRVIDIKKLNELKLKIEDYSEQKELRELIVNYNDLVCQYYESYYSKKQGYLHSRIGF